jgi:ABC-type phosphate transport system substrate-binding protein
MHRTIVITALLLSIFAGAARRAGAQNVTIIVNDAVPATTLSMDEVARVFQKERVRWPNGLTTEPVDLAPEAGVREHFSRMVFTRSTAQMKAWWQAQIFSGRAVPPVELSNEAQVLEYVKLHAGAIAYVSPSTALVEGVHRLRVVR